MLEEVACFSISPPAFQGLLQTSVVQARNPLTGIAMSFLKKIEVKHLPSPRSRAKTHFGAPVNDSDASGYAMPGFSMTEAGASNANASDFAADFFAEHSSPVAVDMPAQALTRFQATTRLLKSSSRPQAPTAARSAQA